MPAETEEPQPQYQSWLYVLALIDPDHPAADLDEWQTRDKVLAELRDAGEGVTARTLAHWESIGALPRPVVKWRDGRTQALYPPGAAVLIEWVGILRGKGRRLEEIGRLLWWDASTTVLHALYPLRTTTAQRLAAAERDLARQLDVYRVAYESHAGRAVAGVEAQITTDAGDVVTVSAPRVGLSSGWVIRRRERMGEMAENE